MTRKCIFEGCNTTPSYNIIGQHSPIYCVQHKSPDMISVRAKSVKLCIFEDCKKVPNFNFEGEKQGKYCASHKQNGMIDVKARFCIEDGCTIKPIFNLKGEIKPLYCYIHKKENMIDIVHKRCEEDKCTKLPCYANSGEKYGKYCAKHKKEGMLNVINKRCIFEGCSKHAAYNYIGICKKIYCASHKKDGMIVVNGNYCKELNCKTIANYNYENEKRGLYCTIHKKEIMIDVKNKHCKTPLCNTIASNIQYQGYCIRCFIYMFPDSDLVKNYKTKEKEVTKYIINSFPEYAFSFDKPISKGESKRRPDCFLDLESHVIICEVDENQHTSYDCSCENKRLMELSKDVGHRPLIFIRFNPDAYINKSNEKISSCWTIDKRGICKLKSQKINEWTERLKVLKEQIEYWIDNKTEKTVEIVELFYNSNV